MHFEKDVYEDWMETFQVQNIFNIYNNICNSNNKHKKVYKLLNCKQRVVTQATFEKFRPAELQVPLDKPKSIEGFPFEFNWGEEWYKNWDQL
jgi:hypothetical protein